MIPIIPVSQLQRRGAQAPGGRLATLPPLTLYVHYPWCLRKCPYCDFNSHQHPAGIEDIPETRYLDALRADLEQSLPLVWGRKVHAVFIGGGTPSLLSAAGLDRLLSDIRALLPLEADAEITLEANPGTVDAERFERIHAAGINRLSMGVQALNDADLKFLGRRHGVAEARTAWRAAAKIFPRTSFDLIYARPKQTLAMWEEELREALDEVQRHGITHLSLYQLTMEDGTPMAAEHARGKFVLPVEDDAAVMYERTQALCDAAGFPAYEVSNHAAEGAACRHNLTYWRGGDYVGVGPGAHGRLTLDGATRATRATRQIKAPAIWLKRVDRDGHGTQEDELLTAEARAEELVMVGLRVSDGLDKDRFARLAGRPLESLIDPTGLAMLTRENLLQDTPSRLVATPRGRLALNAVIKALLA